MCLALHLAEVMFIPRAGIADIQLRQLGAGLKDVVPTGVKLHNQVLSNNNNKKKSFIFKERRLDSLGEVHPLTAD